MGFFGGSTGKESACNEGDLAVIPELGRSPGEGKGYPLFWPENSMDCRVHGVTKSWTQLSSRVEATQQHQQVIHQVSFSFYVLLISYESLSKWQIAKEKAVNTYGGNISCFECKCETFNLEIIIATRHQSIIKLRITRQGRQSSTKLKNQ